MEAKFLQGSLNAMVDYTPSGALAAGEVVVINGSCRIPHLDIAAGVLGSLSVCGIYTVVKDGGAAVSFTNGDPVFWSAGTNLATATSSDTWLGECIEDAGATATSVKVLVFPRGTLYSGNLAASGTLTVTGNATFGGTVGITGAFTASSTSSLVGAVTTTAALTVGTRLMTSATNTGVTATASTYTALTANKDINILVGVTGQTGYGWKLPTGVAGMQLTLIETAGFAGVLVPATGGTIDGLSANAAIVIGASKRYRLVCTAADTWYSMEISKATAV